mmetsp:Transcript_96165/g.292117  ORF Transcript_96165/g.292117 Transcript_96165/m.292117 type:complete len:236 (+) Transcript_96165:293-1000(+)
MSTIMASISLITAWSKYSSRSSIMSASCSSARPWAPLLALLKERVGVEAEVEEVASLNFPKVVPRSGSSPRGCAAAGLASPWLAVAAPTAAGARAGGGGRLAAVGTTSSTGDLLRLRPTLSLEGHCKNNGSPEGLGGSFWGQAAILAPTRSAGNTLAPPPPAASLLATDPVSAFAWAASPSAACASSSSAEGSGNSRGFHSICRDSTEDSSRRPARSSFSISPSSRQSERQSTFT